MLFGSSLAPAPALTFYHEHLMLEFQATTLPSPEDIIRVGECIRKINDSVIRILWSSFGSNNVDLRVLEATVWRIGTAAAFRYPIDIRNSTKLPQVRHPTSFRAMLTTWHQASRGHRRNQDTHLLGRVRVLPFAKRV